MKKLTSINSKLLGKDEMSKIMGGRADYYTSTQTCKITTGPTTTYPCGDVSTTTCTDTNGVYDNCNEEITGKPCK